jgi:hypothetical protein
MYKTDLSSILYLLIVISNFLMAYSVLFVSLHKKKRS